MLRDVAQRAVEVEVRLAAALARRATQKLVVTEVCRELGISRQTFYKYERRLREGGLQGVLVERSRRPESSPRQVCAGIEDLIVLLRKELAEQGWDNGATSVLARLPDRMAGDPALAGLPVPSRATVHRVLRRRGQVIDEPAKRPRSADLKRFEYPQPNACWQVDATGWLLADGSSVAIVQVLDDHSRALLAHHAAPTETASSVWTALLSAINEHGAPYQVLTDRGAAMLGRPDTLTVVKKNLQALGIRCVTSRGYHPQTCGKNERVHQTLHRWLAARPACQDLAELNTLLQQFQHDYNTARPHQSLQMLTPMQRYYGQPKLGPGAELDPPPLQVLQVTASARGIISLGLDRQQGHIGRQWHGTTVTVLRRDLDVAVFHHDQLIAEIRVDPNRIYQSSGQPNTSSRQRPRPRTTPPGT